MGCGITGSSGRWGQQAATCSGELVLLLTRRGADGPGSGVLMLPSCAAAASSSAAAAAAAAVAAAVCWPCVDLQAAVRYFLRAASSRPRHLAVRSPWEWQDHAGQGAGR
jgi:hypothetical protein